jgi:predicted pyridoxine 5'-phosphate oxidase superfamily flavin-nucleotide-binding protein
MTAPTSDIAFSPSVKAVQERRGSRDTYARIEARGGFRTAMTADLLAFLAIVDTAFLATASADGQPYAQHRGGPPGFIKALGPNSVGFADFAGNRQYITTGNLAENDRAFLFLMDYAHARRVKLWGHARVSDDPQLIARLMPEGYAARPEQAVLFDVDAWDINCPQHIPRKLNLADAAALLDSRDRHIERLEAELAALRGVRDSAGTQKRSMTET